MYVRMCMYVCMYVCMYLFYYKHVPLLVVILHAGFTFFIHN